MSLTQKTILTRKVLSCCLCLIIYRRDKQNLELDKQVSVNRGERGGGGRPGGKQKKWCLGGGGTLYQTPRQA